MERPTVEYFQYRDAKIVVNLRRASVVTNKVYQSLIVSISYGSIHVFRKSDLTAANERA